LLNWTFCLSFDKMTLLAGHRSAKRWKKLNWTHFSSQVCADPGIAWAIDYTILRLVLEISSFEIPFVDSDHIVILILSMKFKMVNTDSYCWECWMDLIKRYLWVLLQSNSYSKTLSNLKTRTAKNEVIIIFVLKWMQK
jgi:hypothetical protein